MTPSGSSRPLNTRSLLEDNSQTNRQVLLLMFWMAPSLSRLKMTHAKHATVIPFLLCVDNVMIKFFIMIN